MTEDDSSQSDSRPGPAIEHGAGPALRSDVFLSHNSRDKPAVERIAERLQRSGVEPWIDAWNLTPGGRWQDEIVEGLRQSSACAVFIGPHGLGDWVREELAIALDRAAKDRRFRLFVVLLPGVPEPFDPTTLPPFLSTRTWVDLREGHDDPRGTQALINAVRGVALGSAAVRQIDASVCPYRGLEVFDADNAEFFFGRDADIQQVIEHLREKRFLAVLGSSGTGKSSLVRAGVAPALRNGRLPGSDRWIIRILRPGARPLVELAACLTQLSPSGKVGMQETLDSLATDQRTLDLAAALALGGTPPDEQFVLVVDQFEEVFTLCSDASERGSFLNNLLYASRTPGGRCIVVLTMRADFYPRCATSPELAQQVSRDQYLVSAMTLEGLRQAVAEPAFRVGLDFEEGLVETILNDVDNEPGALPLLEHAMLELWAQRSGSMLTLEAYRRIGGVSGALARRADLIYEQFSPERQKLARQVLLRLTQPGDGSEDTRRRCSIAELQTADVIDADLDAVVQTLVAARLLTVGGDVAGTQTVDVAHEALIRGWPRLREWIDEDRAGLREHRRITEGALEWERLGRDESVLFRGARLATAREWRLGHEPSLNPLERQFLDAGAALLTRERHASRRRTRRAIAVLSFALVVTSALAIVAVIQRERAQSSDQRAIASSRFAFAQELASHAIEVMPTDPELGLRLAIEAVRIQDNRIASDALRRILLTAPIRSFVSPGTGFTGAVAVSPSGEMLALGAEDGQTELWDPSSGERVAILAASGASVVELAFSPDGEQLATADSAGDIRIWDAADRELLATLSAGAGSVSSVQFSADGERLLGQSSGAGPLVWDVASGEQVLTVNNGEGSTSGAIFADGGRMIVTIDPDGVVASWSATTGEPIAQLAEGSADASSILAVPNSPNVLVLALFSPLRVWDASTGEQLEATGALGRLSALNASLSEDGSRVAIAGQLGFTGVWDVEDWKKLSDAPGSSIATLRAEISADGGLAAVQATDGRVHIWDPVNPDNDATLQSPDWLINRIMLNSASKIVVVTSLFGQVIVFDYAALDAPDADLLDLAESRNPRELTDGERVMYLHEGAGS